MGNSFTTTSATLGTSLPSYLDANAADAIAAGLPGLASYKAAALNVKNAALSMATDRFDTARRYQGRRYSTTQAFEFPRVAYESGRVGTSSAAPTYDPNAAYPGNTIWDWDPTTNAAVVPEPVKRAVVYEADSIIKGDRDRRLQQAADGLQAVQTGSLAETLRGNLGPDNLPVLCREADRISRQYELRSGRLL